MNANIRHLRSAALIAAALLASCSQQRPAPQPVARPSVAPRPVLTPAPRTINGWRDMPATPGTWTWASTNGRSVASFGVSGVASLLVLTCDRTALRMTLARPGMAPAAVPLTVATTESGRTLSAAPAAGMLVAALTPRDPLLDAMAFSRGRFAIETPGLAALYLPSSPEFSRVIEDCR